jgi:hypothetical protein
MSASGVESARIHMALTTGAVACIFARLLT